MSGPVGIQCCQCQKAHTINLWGVNSPHDFLDAQKKLADSLGWKIVKTKGLKVFVFCDECLREQEQTAKNLLERLGYSVEKPTMTVTLEVKK